MAQMAAWLRNLLSFLNGFRKLVICLIAITLATAFLLSGHLTGDQYTSMLTVTIPAYFAGNVTEHLTTTVKDWLKEKATNGK